MFGNLFMSKKKKEQLAAEKREQEYKESCDARDRQRWAQISGQKLEQVKAALDDVYQRAQAGFDQMKRPYGVRKFMRENLSGPGEILGAWKKDYYGFKKAGFGTHDARLERRMYAKLRLSFEFYRGNMAPAAKDALRDVLHVMDEYMDRLCSMEVEDAAEIFQQRYD